jgi:hypothetical protein
VTYPTEPPQARRAVGLLLPSTQPRPPYFVSTFYDDRSSSHRCQPPGKDGASAPYSQYIALMVSMSTVKFFILERSDAKAFAAAFLMPAAQLAPSLPQTFAF